MAHHTIAAHFYFEVVIAWMAQLGKHLAAQLKRQLLIFRFVSVMSPFQI